MNNLPNQGNRVEEGLLDRFLGPEGADEWREGRERRAREEAVKYRALVNASPEDDLVRLIRDVSRQEIEGAAPEFAELADACIERALRRRGWR
jgi:hypothetical protein